MKATKQVWWLLFFVEKAENKFCSFFLSLQ